MIKDLKLETICDYLEDALDIITALENNYIIDKAKIKLDIDKQNKIVKLTINQGGNE